MRDLLPIIRVDRHLIKEWPSGFHAAVGMVRGEKDAVDTDRVCHAQIGVVRQTPALIYYTRLLVGKLTTKNSAIEILPQVFPDGPLQPTIFLQRKSVVGPPRHPTQRFEVMAHNDLQRRKPVEHPAQD